MSNLEKAEKFCADYFDNEAIGTEEPTRRQILAWMTVAYAAGRMHALQETEKILSRSSVTTEP